MTAIVPLRWSLRIDDQGIGRRFLFRWDVWSWADISSGRIEKRHPYTLVDPKRPWWRRKLSLEYMTRADISHTMEVINTYYQLPTAPQVPDILEIKYGAFRRRLARFDSKGVHLQGGRDMRQYLWSEVRRVHVTRMDPLRRDFKSLELVLPDREIELKLVSTQYGTHPSWSGATGEAVNEVLERYVPADRIDRDIVGERPARRIDVENKLRMARRERREWRLCFLVIMSCLVAALIWMAVAESVLKALVMTGMSAVLCVPVCVFLVRDSRSRCAELERQLASFDEIGGE